MKIVVIGGSGLIGSKLVEKLREDGHETLAASPDSGVDTLTGEGLAKALEDAQIVVDVTNAPIWDEAAVLDFFQTSSRNLLAAEAVAGVKHHVVLSIVGTDRLHDSGYYRAKLAQEGRVKAATVPYTILRATQFFEFISRIADSSTDGETVHLPPVLVQPGAADDVASALAEVALSAPVNGIVELAGPERFRLDELAQRVLSANHDPRRVMADVRARYFGAELDDHSLTPGSNPRIAPTRFEDWLRRFAATQTNPPTQGVLMKPTIVLVHSAFAESATWNYLVDSLLSATVDGAIVLVGRSNLPLLFAAGRAGNTEGLGLAEAGIELDERGRIVVDDRYQTSAEGIYAAGDVIGPPALASVSMEQGRVAICHAFKIPFKETVDPLAPYGVYSIPEVGMVGMTEEAAAAAGIEYEVGRAWFAQNARARIAGTTEGLVKLVFRQDDRTLLGAHVMGDAASELVHVAQATLHAGSSIDRFIHTTFNVPTYSEAFKYAAYDGLQRLEGGPARARRSAREPILAGR